MLLTQVVILQCILAMVAGTFSVVVITTPQPAGQANMYLSPFSGCTYPLFLVPVRLGLTIS
jgi:hypothetical protein